MQGPNERFYNWMKEEDELKLRQSIEASSREQAKFMGDIFKYLSMVSGALSVNMLVLAKQADFDYSLGETSVVELATQSPGGCLALGSFAVTSAFFVEGLSLYRQARNREAELGTVE